MAVVIDGMVVAVVLDLFFFFNNNAALTARFFLAAIASLLDGFFGGVYPVLVRDNCVGFIIVSEPSTARFLQDLDLRTRFGSMITWITKGLK